MSLLFSVRDDNNKLKEGVFESQYRPESKEVKDALNSIRQDALHGEQILTKSRPEYDWRSILEECDVNQKAFNSYVPPESEDPDEAWRAQTVRPVTRNKLISIAAHVTATIMYPNVFAQNTNDDEDKAAAEVMRDLIEWHIENSNYEKSFINGVIAALVDPAVILSVEFAEVLRKVRVKMEDGRMEMRDVLDDVLSGFQMHVIPIKHLLIANVYEPNIQRQRFVIRKRYIDYQEARQIFGKNPNFKYVKSGSTVCFDKASDTFYDMEVDEHEGLVEHLTYYNRSQDLELDVVGGVLMQDPTNPLSRKDKMYPMAKGIYEPINNGVFFYGKSAANKLGSDQQVVDTLYNMVIDGTYLSLMPPMALYGAEHIDSSVTIPGVITTFKNPDTKLESIAPRSDIRAGLETIGNVERSMSESSQDSSRAGIGQAGGERTAREVLLLEQNARIALGLFGKEIGFLVEDVGKLMVGSILQHATVAEVDEIADGLKYRSFLLSDRVFDGKPVSKKIVFTDKFFNMTEMSDEDKLKASFKLLKEEQTKGDMRISEVNPHIFRRVKYLVKIDPDEYAPKSKALERALGLEMYDRAIQNPNIDPIAVTSDFLFEPYKAGSSSKYVKKEAKQNPKEIPEKKGVDSNFLGQMTGSNSLGIAASSDL